MLWDAARSFPPQLTTTVAGLEQQVAALAARVAALEDASTRHDAAGARLASFEQQATGRIAVLEGISKLRSVEDAILDTGIRALKEWTAASAAAVVYDSAVDPFTVDGLFAKVKNKPNVAVIGFTTGRDVFGEFYRIPITETDQKAAFDPSIFVFSFEAHGRCAAPKKFAVWPAFVAKAQAVFCKREKERTYGFLWFWVDGQGGFYLGNERSMSYCKNAANAFAGLDNTTLTGANTTHNGGEYHHPTRLVAVQLS